MGSQQPPENEPTRRIDPVGPTPRRAAASEPTRRIPAPGEAQAYEWSSRRTSGEEGSTHDYSQAPQREPGHDGRFEAEKPARARAWLFGLVGALLGFMLAFLIIALSTGDEGNGAELASQERISELEADLADREAQIDALEARVAEAEAAAGERDDDLEAQRQALDERATALDERSVALDEREAALDGREAEIVEREQNAEDPAGGGQPQDPPAQDEGPTDGVIPEVDDETVENIVQRVLDRLRELF